MQIKTKNPGRLITVTLIFLICVLCNSPCGVVWASPAAGIRNALEMGNYPVPRSPVEWLKGAIQQDYVLGDRETAEWLNKLLEGSKNGEFTSLETVDEVLDELLKKMMKELRGDHSQKLNKIAIRLVYGAAGIHPRFADDFIRRVDSDIDLSDSAILYRKIDLGDIDIMPAKPYFLLTFDMVYKNMARKSETQLIALAETMRILATASIEGGYAKFSMIDYEAASFSYMNGLDPSDYNKAIKLHEKIFASSSDELVSAYQAQGFFFGRTRY